MNTTLLLSNIQKHITLDTKEITHFKQLLSDENFSKKEFILREGDRCDYLYFVNKGILRAFYVNKEGKDSTVMFALQDWWITDMHCFLNQLPAMVNIQAVESTNVLKLSKSKLDTLYEDIPKFEKLFRILMEKAYCREQLRVIQNLSSPAIDRYQAFTEKYPQIVKQVPQKQIASYLGITPEFLSHIRAKKNS